ncbi:MAG: hypothetical protein U9P70_03235, partial [Patescibacteria group bacterium]|nr:hypothetical protein [Patescibacteria group bacterium]
YVDLRLEKLDEDIEMGISRNRFQVEESKIKDVASLLDNHSYYSELLEMLQDVISDNVYLTSCDFSFGDKGNLSLVFTGSAKNYVAAIEQIAIFKDSYWIDNVNIDALADSGTGEITFNGSLGLKRDLILYHEYYWNFGIELLSLKIDRDLKIEEYSAVLKGYDSEDILEIKFSGISYDEKKMILFENDLKEIGDFIKDVSVSYDLSEEEHPSVIRFNGKMKLEF